MKKKINGGLYQFGQKKHYYLRYKKDGRDYRVRLLDHNGKPITKKQDAQYAAERYLQYVNESNKAEQLRRLCNDLRDAEQAAHEAKKLLLNQQALIKNGWSLFLTCPKRPISCKRDTCDPPKPKTTAAAYYGYYNRFVQYMQQYHPDIATLAEVTSECAAGFMSEIGKTIASGTFNKYLQFFNCFYNAIIQAGKITGGNPFSDIDRREHVYNSKRPLSVAEITTLLSNASGELKILIALGYFSGMRLGDCCTLKWNEIDLKRKIIERIPRKNIHRVRDWNAAAVKIGIAPYLYDMLMAIPDDKRQNYLLPDMAQKYLNRQESIITRNILRHFERCGIKIHRSDTGTGTGKRAIVEAGFHSLRYSYISHNAEVGVPAAIVQRNAGHSNPAMTMHYTKISDAAAVKYAEMLNLGNTVEDVNTEVDRITLKELAETLPITEIKEIIKKIRH